MSQRRYDISTPGLSDVLSRGRRGILFVANHQTLVDGPLAIATLGPELNLRPILAAHRLRGPFGPLLKAGMNRFNGAAIPSVLKEGRSAFPVAHEVLDEIATQLSRGQNFYLFYNGFVQRSVADSPEAGRALYEILRRLPQVRVVLVRQRGAWGSRWSFGYPSERDFVPTNQVLGRGLMQTLVNLPISLVKPLPRRAITYSFEEASDFPRAGHRREIHEYVQDFFGRSPEVLTLVPRY